ncbi:MAG TPA: hypothetical protein VE549_02385, partial [Myxococcaceae bacterium]|nr:hypothetical protein [Myxococcaceae bacterium]
IAPAVTSTGGTTTVTGGAAGTAGVAGSASGAGNRMGGGGGGGSGGSGGIGGILSGTNPGLAGSGTPGIVLTRQFDPTALF